jgi:hypothetical protein
LHSYIRLGFLARSAVVPSLDERGVDRLVPVFRRGWVVGDGPDGGKVGHTRLHELLLFSNTNPLRGRGGHRRLGHGSRRRGDELVGEPCG